MDIVWAATTIGKANYVRPNLVLDVFGDSLVVAPISSKPQFFNSLRGDFTVRVHMEGFQESRLDPDSFILGETQTIPMSAVRGKKGRLSGDLLNSYMQVNA
jgi:hypothetical protein